MVGLGEHMVGLGEHMVGLGEHMVGLGEHMVGLGEHMAGLGEHTVLTALLCFVQWLHIPNTSEGFISSMIPPPLFVS